MLPAFFLLLFVFATAALAESVTLRRDLGSREIGLDGLHFLPPRRHSATDDDPLEVLDVVLVASVDGKFHALNRATGSILWSMPSSPSLPRSSSSSTPTSEHEPAQPVPSILGPLVSTKHLDVDPDFDDDPFAHETYIVEPQSGDIYVTSSNSPTAPLQRLPFSMSQLVDMSPFSFGEADNRVFVGHKKTSILLVELETGRVKSVLDSECPWDARSISAEQDAMDVDLDELEGLKPSRQTPNDIFIGRTDYHITILTHPPSRSSQPLPVQHLSFSTYGPNNQDLKCQAAYHRSVDDLYLEPLPNGELLSLKVRGEINTATSLPEIQAPWGQRFLNPIVAVFDVVRSARKPSPFVLLQPRLRLRDVFATAIPQHNYPNDEVAFVGLVPGTGSLFVLSPDHFPLVAFSDPAPTQRIEGIDGVMISSEQGMLQCFEGTTDRRCLTGVRALRADSRSRLARLLDGVPGPAGTPPLPSATGDPARSGNSNSQAYAENKPLIVFDEGQLPVVQWELLARGQKSWVPSSSTLLLALVSVVASFIWFKRNAPPRSPETTATLRGPAGSVPGELARKIAAVRKAASIAQQEAPNDGTRIPPLESQAVETSPSANTALSENPHLTPIQLPPEPPTATLVTASGTPMPSSAADDEAKISPAKLESPEGAEDVGEVKKKHRKRRRKRKGDAKDAAAEGGEDAENDDAEGTEEGNLMSPLTPSLVPPRTPATPPSPSLVVSDTVLGYGSHGTIVYVGSLQGRAVAVKRLLRDFVTLADREVSLLKDADDHPNVIRYYYQEAHDNFLYIALELCPASLADIIERPDQFREIAISFNPKRAVRQITSGLRHLHALKIVHRDIKPQNILISSAKKGESSGNRMLISDFGLCRKLEVDQTSFLPTAGGVMGVGTFGWRAPEILRGDVKLDEAITDDNSQSSNDSVGTATGSNHSGAGKATTRLTKSVDIFALGCLYYYCLTNGGHPFGDRFEREVNIMRDQKSLEGLEGFGEEGSEAVDLIGSMLAADTADRPDTTTCLTHPYFWDPGRRLGFLQDASDRFEIMCRDPRDPHLVVLENNAIDVVGPDWPARLDKVFVENLGKFRKYDGRSVQDLLRALRNKKHHYQDLPEHVKRHVGSMPEGYLSYFTRRYPHLFIHVHSVIANSSLRQESMFRSYFDLTD
ncbi:hypothetical protein F5148DRAFT_5717 [Russula earlei]|uniref:Uncharacterized protein n=1 Tax=Russula earlei TaxID=71964 RepID=A0ACC0UPL2_9AGAM|nr:hypothetical protein F5148DRAFT_5717 [Russula earlei]